MSDLRVLRGRRSVARLASAVAVTAALAMVAGPLAGAAGASTATGGTPGSVATLKITAQKVEVKKKGADAFKTAKDGQAVHVGDTVRTDATGQAEIDYDADTYTRLDVNTSFKVTKLTDDQGNRQVEGTVESGQSWNRTTALTESESFEQTGAGATAAVTGTAYALSCSDSTHCSFTAIVDTFTLTGTDGLQKLLSPLDQCDSTSGALCADITKIDPSQLGDWILQNLILDVARGFPFPNFPVTFTVFVEGNQVFATAPEPTTGPSSPTGPGTPSAFDGSPGVNAPPSTLGPYTMATFANDARILGQDVTTVPTPVGGNIGFSIPLRHLKIDQGWSNWSNGYTGDVYCSDCGSNPNPNTLTITLPPNTLAFYFYAQTDAAGAHSLTATANDGTSSGPISVNNDVSGDCAAPGSCAKYFGFYATDPSLFIQSITVTVASGGLGVGEFGINCSGGACDAPVTLSQPQAQAQDVPADPPAPEDTPADTTSDAQAGG